MLGVEHEPTFQRDGYRVRYLCSCGFATPWVGDIATAGGALVRHVARSESWERAEAEAYTLTG